MNVSKYFFLSLLLFFPCFAHVRILVEYLPIDLLNDQRFDVMARYLYAKHRELGVKSNWGQEVYEAYLKVTNNLEVLLCKPNDRLFDCAKEHTEKSGLQDFLDAFHLILDSIKNNGFDTNKSVLPIDRNSIVIDGGHRLTAALLYNTPVVCKMFSEIDRRQQATSELLKQRTMFVSTGLVEKYLDAMALEYAFLKHNSYIAAIFPSSKGQHNQIRKILSSNGIIIYEKTISLENNGPLNFMRLLYAGEAWIGNYSNSFNGARTKMPLYFPEKKGEVRIFLYEPNNIENIRKLKNQIRALLGIDHDLVYINDIHKKTMRIAQAVFVKNSIHWLNHAHVNYCKNFERYIKEYKRWLQQNDINTDCFCIDGSAPLSAYGLKDCKGLDFIHHNYDDQVAKISSQDLNDHNNELVHHLFSKDDIIFNPKYHFYYKGVKCATLKVVRAMKLKRNEFKDQRDIHLLQLLKQRLFKE